MARKQETLEEGLERSANKRGLTGKEKHRYIGGALYHLGKAKTRNGKHIGPSSPRTARPAPAPKPKAPPKPKVARPAPAPKPKAARPAPKPREKLVLVVKKNGPASKQRSYDVYSLYRPDGSQFSASTFRKRSAANQAAAAEMNAYNHPSGILTQKRIRA